MATGSVTDFAARIRALLPNGWFGGPTPVLDSLLAGVSAALASAFALTEYARLQTRIATATDSFLDLIAFDFFGVTLPRRAGEADASFRLRIQAALLLERGTRNGMIRVLELLTGRTPLIFEPARTTDTGGYNTNTMGYGVAGAYGSLQLPFQAFVTAYRPIGQGVPFAAGYGTPQGAYNTPSRLQYASRDQIAGSVTDDDIYAAIDATKPVGTIAWTRILS